MDTHARTYGTSLKADRIKVIITSTFAVDAAGDLCSAWRLGASYLQSVSGQDLDLGLAGDLRLLHQLTVNPSPRLR